MAGIGINNFGGNGKGNLPKKNVNTKQTIDKKYKLNYSSGLKPDNRLNKGKLNDTLVNKNNDRTITTGNFYKYDEKVEVENFIRGENGSKKSQFGVPSLFNQYAILVHPKSDSSNNVSDFYLGTDGIYSKENRTVPDIGTLLDKFDPDKNTTEPYYAYDFLFSKYYKKIPLNRLITFRRFTFPTYDNLTFSGQKNEEYPPIAQAITYFGEPTGNNLKDILRINGKIEWKELTADVWDVQGNEQGYESSPFMPKSGFLGLIGKGINISAGNSGDLSGRGKVGQDAARQFGDIDYTNKRLGPVNVINKTNVRERGIGSELKFNLVFEYSLRSYDGINPRIAMLDLIFNFFSLVFNNAKFWGGANRYFPRVNQFEFFGGKKAMSEFYSGNYGAWLSTTFDTFKTGLGNIADALGKVITGIMSGDLSALTGLVKGLGSKVLDIKSYKTRPQAVGFHSLLSGLPTGEWHVTIGNPLQPIAKIGNLIVESWDMEFGEELGLDDFPTTVKFTVSLKSGRPRDKGDLESILLEGQGRGYNVSKSAVDVLNNTSATTNDGNIASGKQSINQVKRKKLYEDGDLVTKVAGSAF